MMTSCLLIVMWQVKKEKENFNLNIQTQKKSKKKIEKKKISKKNLSATFHIFKKSLSPTKGERCGLCFHFFWGHNWLTNWQTCLYTSQPPAGSKKISKSKIQNPKSKSQKSHSSDSTEWVSEWVTTCLYTSQPPAGSKKGIQRNIVIGKNYVGCFSILSSRCTPSNPLPNQLPSAKQALHWKV